MIAWKPAAYDWNLASVRLRSVFPSRLLKQAGWPCEIFNAGRLSQYRLVIFQKAYSEQDLPLALRLREAGCKIVFDLCDNHFYSPPGETNANERLTRLHQMIRLADAVSVSTPSLARLVPDKPAAVIDDAVDDYSDTPADSLLLRVLEWLRRRTSPHTRLVWFGNAGADDPPFGLVSLAAIVPELNLLHTITPISLGVISNSKQLYRRHLVGARFPTRHFLWHRHTFRRVFQRHDICLLPTTPHPFTTCKSNNRVLLSLLLGLPVVANLIPSYEEFHPYMLIGNWSKNLRAYIEDRALAQAHVQAGQSLIREHHGPGRVLRQWSALFNSLLEHRPPSADAIHEVVPKV